MWLRLACKVACHVMLSSLPLEKKNTTCSQMRQLSKNPEKLGISFAGSLENASSVTRKPGREIQKTDLTDGISHDINSEQKSLATEYVRVAFDSDARDLVDLSLIILGRRRFNSYTLTVTLDPLPKFPTTLPSQSL